MNFSVITEDILRAVMPSAKAQDLSDFVAPLNAALREFEVSTPVRQAAFLGIIAEESDQLWHLRDHFGSKRGEEYASGEAYEDRHDLGNVHPGDGIKYKGHGLIQTTGLTNHRKVGEALKHDFVAHPEDLCTPEWACRAAGFYWKTHGCSELADANTVEAFMTITKRVNGGLNGLSKREAFWTVAKKALAI